MKSWLNWGLWGLGIGIILTIIAYFMGDWPGYTVLILLLFPLAMITVLGACIGSWIDFAREKSEGNKNSTGLGIAGFVLGLLSIILFNSSFGSLMGILGLTFSIVQIKRNKTKLAVVGLILSIIGIVLAIIMFVVGMIAIKNLQNKFLG